MGTQDESQLAEIESLKNARDAAPVEIAPRPIILPLAKQVDVPQAGGGSRSGL